MVYRFCPEQNDMLHMTERHSCSRIAYFSKQKIDALYPDAGYEVIGEIGNFAKEYEGQDVVLTVTGKKTPVFPRGSIKRPFEWIAGYAAVGENIFVAVVRGVIPRF